jgi:hypothetical protein
MSGKEMYAFSGKGSRNLGQIPLSHRGSWRLQVRTNNKDAVATLSFSNGETRECHCKARETDDDYVYRYEDFLVSDESLLGDLVVSAAHTCDWQLKLSLTREASSSIASNQTEENAAMTLTSPQYVCVNIDINDPVNNRLNVRSGPGYTEFDVVEGGDRDAGGGALQGTRYKVVGTETNGELVSGNPIWHKIDFKDGVTGWVPEFYVDAC